MISCFVARKKEAARGFYTAAGRVRRLGVSVWEKCGRHEVRASMATGNFISRGYRLRRRMNTELDEEDNQVIPEQHDDVAH